VTISRAKNAES